MSTVAAADNLPTPVLDAESPNLLQSISSHGGYAYVSMATLAASGDSGAAEAALDMAWEQLHSGPWHSVLPVWRDAYSMACLYVAKLQFGKGDFGEALRVLDLGLIMGGMLLRKDLDDAVGVISRRAGEIGDRSEGCSRKLVEVLEFDKAEALHILPVKSLSCKNVMKRSTVSLEAFLCDHFLPHSPVIISDCMAHWPARTRWNDLDYLKRVAGDRTVPVEVGKNYLCQEWKQELITFSQFLERARSNDSSVTVPTYLAQHPLFDQINELRNDICIPEYCSVGGGELRPINAWFGPAGTVTPLHHDPHHNLLAQVVGKKYIRLYPASISSELYPHSETMLCNSSQVDLDNIDEKEFPKLLVERVGRFSCILMKIKAILKQGYGAHRNC
ncbi:Bifunctional peptidase and arginyl-hydroxylase JMJD5 [Euphorbia peplus]|nr:Bifunctional peptidase and arginyl-hydroxylase JMJD5 [Euphorbia peplus]